MGERGLQDCYPMDLHAGQLGNGFAEQVLCLRGTTLKEDQKIAKRLSGWDTDDEISTPSLSAVTMKLSVDECRSIHLCQQHLFSSVSGFDGNASSCNIGAAVTNLMFATLLVHLKDTMTTFPQPQLAAAVHRACEKAECTLTLLLLAGTIV